MLYHHFPAKVGLIFGLKLALHPLLEVKGLSTYFYIDAGVVRAVDDVDFILEKGGILGIIGESGCGKTVTALSIIRLIPSPPGKIVAGQVLLEGEDLLKKSIAEMRMIRGNDISMIFQEPMTSLNPVFTIGNQIMETIRLHQKLSRRNASTKAIEMLKLVGIPSPKYCMNVYPHQLSGGMRQRIMIAMALSCNPRLLIADEPTTALDVTIQAQILTLLNKIREELSMPIIFITHDLGIIAELVEQVLVMYCGRIVERSDVKNLFANPLHPYTLGLMRAIPRIYEEVEHLEVIKGVVPNPDEMPLGCRFHPRCDMAEKRCSLEVPFLKEVNPGHYVACWLV